MIVRKVDWMHAGLYFAQEMLERENSNAKIFSILTLAYIIKKYPTEQ